MTEAQGQQNPQAQPAPVEQKQNEKEYNFRMVERRAQEAERRAQEAERRAEDANRRAQELSQIKADLHDEDDETDEPYVAPKSLKKQLNRFGQTTQQDIQKAMEQAKYAAKEELKQEMWLENNPDFEKVMSEDNTNKFWSENRDLANTILRMPEGFERQKLVYQTIKRLGIDQPQQKQKESSTQEKIDANRRSGSYMPSGSGSHPYVRGGDFSEQGKKAAFDKIQALKSTMRI